MVGELNNECAFQKSFFADFLVLSFSKRQMSLFFLYMDELLVILYLYLASIFVLYLNSCIDAYGKRIVRFV